MNNIQHTDFNTSFDSLFLKYKLVQHKKKLQTKSRHIYKKNTFKMPLEASRGVAASYE